MKSNLPDAPWRHADGLRSVIAALADGHGGPRYVGGAVRDTLLGLEVSDVDLATMLRPENVIEKLEAAGLKAVPTGLDHGTVTAVADGRNYEITTLRRDVATDGRRAIVEFATDWCEDAARRDFTMNALYADPETGEIFDYFGGLEDLDNGIVRFIGDADQRIAEDYLRVLRYFRFLARYGRGGVNPSAINACAAGASGLTALSRERIAQELTKLLVLPHPVEAIDLMHRNSIFTPFLPELADNAVEQLARLISRENEFRLTPSLFSRLLAILPKSGGITDPVAARLKLSNKLREGLSSRVGADMPKPDVVRALAYRQGLDCAKDVVVLYARDEDIADCLAQLDGWRIPKFSLKGGELIAMGLEAGPMVAKTLVAIENRWITQGFPEDDRLGEIARQTVAEAISASRKA